jgi:putative flavoprotein involved in K+ transport
MATQAEQFETVIIGGGQAGLAAAYHLQQQGRSHVVLDASERIGDSWRKRWDSLRLYSPARYDGLPGMRFPARRTSYPTTNEMADFLEAYATQFDLPVRTGAAVDSLTKEGERYVVTAGERTFESDNVVVATGVMQNPFVPSFARELDPRIRQLHSSDYRNLSQLHAGGVLVVGEPLWSRHRL